MKNYFFKGRDTIEKRCWERFAYPNLRNFNSLHGVSGAILGMGILVVFFLKLAFLTLLEKVHEPKSVYKL